MVSNAAPESARWPKWMRCQSFMHPSSAEYWHMGAITMRLASSTPPIRRGEKSLARVMGDLLGSDQANLHEAGLSAQTRRPWKRLVTRERCSIQIRPSSATPPSTVDE